MKKLYAILCLSCMLAQTAWAMPVKVTMNATSTTMSLQKKGGKSVGVGTPDNKVYAFDAEAGEYILTAYATNGTTENGTIEFTVAEGATNEFAVLTCTAYATNSGWTADNDYTVVANVASKYGDVRVQTIGNSITAGRKTFLALSGDSYNAELVPSAAHQAEGYMTLYKGGTLTANTNVNGAIAMGGDYTVTVPAEANVYIGIKMAHFAPFKEVEAKSIDTEGGNKVYTFRLADGQQYNFRTWKPGGLTQGGIFVYSTDATKRPTLAFTDADYTAKSPQFIDHDVKANGGYNVADIYLNINPQNHLKMQVGDKYDVTGFRTWQIVESTTNNYFLEPDYHYSVQSLTPGKSVSDIISMERTDTDTDQWSKFQAVGNGTVLVTVTYDAIALNQYSNTGAKSSFVGGEYWSAIWPENTGVFVVTVGEDAAGITPNFLVGNNHENVVSEKMAGNNVDADFDVFYYQKGTAGYAYTFKPEGVASVKVAYPTIGANAATYAGFGTEGVTDNGDGSYTVLLKNGRQIVALYDEAGKAQYQVLNAKEVEVTVENASRPGATDYMLGETVDVKFSTLFHPAHKLAGIHNFAATIDYNNVPEGTAVKATSNQYMFASTDAAQKVSITLPATGTPGVPVAVAGGAIKITNFGDPIGNHRNTSRTAGRFANFTAVQHTCYFGVLPELSFNVDIKEIPLTFNGVAGMTIVLKTSNGSVITPNADGTYTLNSYGTYQYEAKADGYGILRSSLVVDNDDAKVIDVELPAINDNTWDGTTTKQPALVDGVYQIGTGYELAWLSANSNGKSAVLTADIDLAGFDFTPIGLTTASAFNGTFDGQGHSVKNLYVKRDATYAGLFGYINAATIQNLCVYGEVNGTASVAGIAGYVNGACTFQNVANYANVNATTAASYVAGIAGQVRAATTKITNVLNAGTITGTNYVGGIYNYYTTAANATVTNVLNVGEIVGTQTGAIRGLTSATATTGKITNAYAPKAYFNDTKTTIVTASQLASGEIAYRLGEAWGQEIGVDAYPVLGGKKVLYDEETGQYYNEQLYDVRVLTFEDADSKGKINVATGETTWSSMIDTEQYMGDILYNEDGENYWWMDENNTWLYGGGNDSFMEYWTGGWAISNYYMPEFKGAGYTQQLAIPLAQSDNQFAVVYNYRSGSPYDMCTTTPLVFADGKAHVVESADVMNTSYALNSMMYGDDFSDPITDGSWFAVNFEGTQADGTVKTVTFKMADGRKFVTDWTTVDLTSLGAVTSLNVYMTGSEDLCGDYGLNVPGYVAIDNIAVRFQKEQKQTLEITDDAPYTQDVITEVQEVTYTRNSAAEWGTICLPFAVQSDNQIQYYQLSDVTDGAFRIRAVESVEAGVPAVYKKLAEGESIQVSAQNVTLLPAAEYQKSSTTIQDWEMKGTFAETTIQGVDKYFIAQNKFWFAEAPVTVKPFRGWFQTSAPSGSRQMIITVDDDQQTGILTLDQNGDLHSAQIYDLQGNRITRGHKGQIVIINGNKVILK